MTLSDNSPWKVKQRPASMEAKFIFDSYEQLRTFLDDVAEQAEALSHHPNVSFGRDYASLVIYSQDGELTDLDYQLAERIEAGFQKVQQG
ncbi:4a-hydroxytetrahydrobiopterin dehydratase [Thiomicrospira sp. WB1]|uniref:4a-hydroxytetrahydrobiopterin dehydratase n=1 Tax=Thiomicrospira sp. WB1 TaxID=1685380 RepID=UPI000746C6E6|nr:4a-hydroxytetrahydrobiopterin dehydratase [Thiomicrospira sp. WB1]KUJ71487.1 hypothetical protein AVO41_08160 [Thiomicrospira sp. WB1]